MEAEEIKGVVPEVRIPGAMGINTYALYVSTRRLVFIQTSKGYHVMGGALFGAVGAMAGHMASESQKKTFRDQSMFQNIDLDSLLRSSKANKEMTLDGIVELRLKKGLGSHRITVFQMKKNKKKVTLDGFLVPPQDYLKYYKKQGQKGKQTVLQYANEAHSLLSTVLSSKLKSDYTGV